MINEGDELGLECPDCGKQLVFEMSFRDEFGAQGHYTTERPLKVCSCGYADDFDPYDEVEE